MEISANQSTSSPIYAGQQYPAQQFGRGSRIPAERQQYPAQRFGNDSSRISAENQQYPAQQFGGGNNRTKNACYIELLNSLNFVSYVYDHDFLKG